MQPSSSTRATIVSAENQNGATIVKATFFFCHYYIVWESNNAGEARGQSWNESLKSKWIPGGSCGYTSVTKRKHFAALSSPRSCWRWFQLQPSCGSPSVCVNPGQTLPFTYQSCYVNCNVYISGSSTSLITWSKNSRSTPVTWRRSWTVERRNLLKRRRSLNVCSTRCCLREHYTDVIMTTMASQGFRIQDSGLLYFQHNNKNTS